MPKVAYSSVNSIQSNKIISNIFLYLVSSWVCLSMCTVTDFSPAIAVSIWLGDKITGQNVIDQEYQIITDLLLYYVLAPTICQL